MSSSDPIYINVSVNTGINSDSSQNLANQISQIVFKNDDAIAIDPSLYYLSLNRALISTSSVPAFIFPIVNGLSQTDPDLSPFKIRFEYYASAGTLLYGLTENIIFQSQVLDKVPKAPSQNDGRQDFTTVQGYYYVYDIAWMLKIFNDSIRDIFGTFCTNLINLGVNLNPDLFPFYTWNQSIKRFSLNFPVTKWDQEGPYPQISFYQDNISGDLFGCPSNVYYKEPRTNYLMLCYDLYDNIVQFNSINYYKMTGATDPLNIWCPMKRILFTITDIPVKTEIESAFTNVPFEAQNNNSLSSIARPNLNIFFDLLVDQDQFAENRNYVQYTAASIAQSRLVGLSSGSIIRNFTISIFWTDVFGNYNPLLSSANQQNSLKLALFSKKTMLL
jgi:hypothetical protein